MSGCTIEVREDAGAVVVLLAGRVDERAHLPQLAARINLPLLVLDLEKVDFINSFGLGDLLALLRSLRGRVTSLTLRGCSPAVVQQLDLIAGTARNLTVESLQLPYLCPGCGYEGSPLVTVAEHGEALRRLAPPTLLCPECSAPMTFNDLPEQYLYYFTHG